MDAALVSTADIMKRVERGLSIVKASCIGEFGTGRGLLQVLRVPGATMVFQK